MAPLRLDTPRLVLRELDLADHAAIHALHSDPEVVRYLSFDAETPEQSVEYVRSAIAESRAEPRTLFGFGVERRERNDLIGRVGLRVVRPEHREAMVWFVFRPDCHGHGYATEATRALLNFAFGTLALHRVFGDCDPRNVRSARLMERLGMRREGRLRENWFLRGEWCDSWLYAILDREWR